MIEIVLSNGDRAEAESCEGAILAARVMIDEATAGLSLAKPTASFYIDGKLVRERVRRQELST